VRVSSREAAVVTMWVDVAIMVLLAWSVWMQKNAS